MIRHYNSIAELRADWLANGIDLGHQAELNWYGGETRETTKRLSDTGDVSLVAEAERIMATMQHEIEVPRRQITACVAGGWPSVPDAIAGRPLSMRRLVEHNDDRAPIFIYADTSCSAGVDARVMRQRGCVILALVMELAKVRPITLHQVTTMGTSRGNVWASRGMAQDFDAGEVILSAKINTAPLDLATAAYVLTSAGFSRRLTYETTYGYGGNGTWPVRYKTLGKDAYAEYIAEALSPNPKTTLYIEAPHIHDEIITQPKAWLEKQIHRFTQSVEENTYA